MTEMTREEKDGEKTQPKTLRTSQGEQARGYLESLAGSELIRELQHALSHAERLTQKRWRVVVSSDGVEINADAPDPGEEAADGGRQAQATPHRIKLPLPLPQKPGAKN